MPHQPLSLSTTPNLHLSLLAQELVAAEEDEGTLHVAAEQHYQITLIRCDQEHLQKSRGGRRGRRNLTRGRWERLWSPVCSQWVGLSEDALGVETWTYNFTSSVSSPLSALVKSQSLAASHLPESICCLHLAPIPAVTALKATSTTSQTYTGMDHRPLSVPSLPILALLKHLRAKEAQNIA